MNSCSAVASDLSCGKRLVAKKGATPIPRLAMLLLVARDCYCYVPLSLSFSLFLFVSPSPSYQISSYLTPLTYSTTSNPPASTPPPLPPSPPFLAQTIFMATPHEKQVMMYSATLDKEIRPVCRKFCQVGIAIQPYQPGETTLLLFLLCGG